MLRPAQSVPRAGPNGSLLAVESALVGQSFWIGGLMLAGGPPGQGFALGSGLIIALAAVVFFVLKKSILTGGQQGHAIFRHTLKASVEATVAVAVVLTMILSPVATNPGAVVASGALGLAFAVVATAVFDWASSRQLRGTRTNAVCRGIRRIAFLGHARACQSLAERLNTVQGNLRVVGIFALAEDAAADDPASGGAAVVDAVVALARDGEVDEVVVAPHTLDDPLLVPAIEQLSGYSVDIAFSPGAIGLAVADLACGPASAVLPLLPLVRQPIRGWSAIAKRAVDVGVSALAIVLLLPIFAVIALAIKLDSPGPVLFKQRRTGLNQKPFLVWKFRTMRHGSDRGGDFRQAIRGDMRVTRAGRLLRPLSVDELPQLFNVLRGEMSLVGPRPHPLPLNERFADQVALYSARHRVLPGITGLAQIHGCRGETDTLEKMSARLHYDLQYIRNWSLWLDFRIMALTLLGRFTHSNAY